MPGPEQPDIEAQVPKGQVMGGHAIGILLLNCWFAYMPGNVANASTYNFPVLYKLLEEATIPKILDADASLLDMIVKGGMELEKQGVRAIVGACGYFGHFQKEASIRLNIPTFLSSVLQAPIIARSLKPNQKLGIICGSSPHLTPGLLSQCGIDDLSHIVIVGAENCLEMQNIGKGTGHLNSYLVEQELVSLAKEFVNKNPDIGAILLECSDMPPYAWAIQNAVRLPVFDYVTMINWIYNAVVRRPIPGFI